MPNIGAIGDLLGRFVGPGGGYESALMNESRPRAPVREASVLRLANPTVAQALGQVVASLIDPHLGVGYGQGLQRGLSAENRRRERQASLDSAARRTEIEAESRRAQSAQATLRQMAETRRRMAAESGLRGRQAKNQQLAAERMRVSAEQHQLDRQSREKMAGEREANRRDPVGRSSRQGANAEPKLPKLIDDGITRILGDSAPQAQYQMRQRVGLYDPNFAIRKAVLLSEQARLANRNPNDPAVRARRVKMTGYEADLNRMQLDAMISRYGADGPRRDTSVAKERNDRARWEALWAERQQLLPTGRSGSKNPAMKGGNPR